MFLHCNLHLLAHFAFGGALSPVPALQDCQLMPRQTRMYTDLVHLALREDVHSPSPRGSGKPFEALHWP